MSFRIIIIIVVLGQFFFNCKRNEENSSIKKPKVKRFNVKVDISKISSPDNPRYFSLTKNINVSKGDSTEYLLTIKNPQPPETLIVGSPIEYKLKGDTFELPKIIKAKANTHSITPLNTIIAKEPKAFDVNPENFYFYTTQQGLKNSTINSLLLDNNGQLWINTYGGGVSIYDGKYFSAFNTSSGLLDNYTTCSIKDHTGNIWIGTEKGLVYYDGKIVSNFTENEGLVCNSVRSIYEDSKHQIWVGTDNGVSCFDGLNFINYGPKQGMVLGGMPAAGVSSIQEDKSGNIWFAGMGGLEYFNGSSFFHFSSKNGLKSDYFTVLLVEKKGDIWMGSDAGLTCFNGKNFIHFTSYQGLCNNGVMSMYQDKKGNVWFGSYGCVSKYNGNEFLSYTSKQGFGINKYVLSITEDKDGQLWFGTEDGLCVLKGNLFSNYSANEGLGDVKNGGAMNVVNCINQDKQNNLWFGLEGGGIVKFNGTSFKRYSKNDGFSYQIKEIVFDKKERMWFSTVVDGVGIYDTQLNCCFYIRKSDGLKPFYVNSILSDSRGGMWCVGAGGISYYLNDSIYNYGEKQGFINNEIWSACVDTKDNLWLGYRVGGLAMFNGKDITNYSFKDAPDIRINSIIESKVGQMVFATEDNGLVIFNGKYFVNLTEDEGLPSNTIKSLIKDKYDNIWLGTSQGLSKLNSNYLDLIEEKTDEPLFINYSYQDGFISDECTKGGFVDAQNNLWLGTSKGVIKLNDTRLAFDSISPSVLLKKVELFGDNIPWHILYNKPDTSFVLSNGIEAKGIQFSGLSTNYLVPEKLVLPYYLNSLSFTCIGVNKKLNKKVGYSYKLVGYDQNWNRITDENKIAYSNLKPGDYILKIKVFNNDGVSTQELEYSFTITPPWWQTWWFRTLAALVLIGTIIFYIKWRERSLKARQKELEVKIDEATFEIKEQKHLIEEKHKEITDSINYAERIQRSFLATKKHLDQNLDEYFIMFKPKDVVSGDFYWSATLNNGMFALVTADSTGHGVPGAIMSLLNITSLEKAIESNTEPHQILNATRNIIIQRLKNDGSEDGGKDGMDCSLCVYDLKNNQLHMAAAHNPVWIVRGNEVIEVKPDKMPVGKHDRQDVSFTIHRLELQIGDVIYTLTDGFPDQFGGEKGKKFMSKNLRELLAKNAHLPMHEQKQILEETFSNWSANLEQVDDVTVIGIRIS